MSLCLNDTEPYVLKKIVHSISRDLSNKITIERAAMPSVQGLKGSGITVLETAH